MEVFEGMPRPAGSRRIPAQVFDAAREASLLREAGRASAEAAVAEARVEVRALRARAAAEGREEGLALATGAAARAVLLADRLAARAEPQLLDLAFAIAGRVLGSLAERDRALVVESAGRALQAARLRADLTLRVHPDDLAAVEGEPGLRARGCRARRWQVVADPEVGRGGAVVETEAGAVDARLDSQLAALRRALDAEDA